MTAPQRALAAATCLSLAVLLAAPSPARAGDGGDNCTGVVTPGSSITEQGVWCLQDDVTITLAVATVAIVKVNNVTIDCLGHEIVATAGAANTVLGIQAIDVNNLTVRNCTFRGLRSGVITYGGSGHLVEDNRFEDLLVSAIHVEGGSDNLVRRNRARNTGGSTTVAFPAVIRSSGDVIDNVIDGVLLTGDSVTYGIIANGHDTEVARNTVRGFEPHASLFATGILATGARVVVADNTVVAGTPRSGFAINAVAAALCIGNRFDGFANAMVGCATKVGNLSP